MVRRLWESQEVQVSRLIRTRYGPIALPKWLGRGKIHPLTPPELQALVNSVGLGETQPDKLRVVAVHPRHARKSKRKR